MEDTQASSTNCNFADSQVENVKPSDKKSVSEKKENLMFDFNNPAPRSETKGSGQRKVNCLKNFHLHVRPSSRFEIS